MVGVPITGFQIASEPSEELDSKTNPGAYEGQVNVSPAGEFDTVTVAGIASASGPAVWLAAISSGVSRP